MCRRCAENVHLRSQATRLLKYYASCADGFAPALLTVEQHTGISTNKVAEVRQRLLDRGLILYKPQTYLILNWNRITTFAALEKPLTIPDPADDEVIDTTAQKRARMQRLFCLTNQTQAASEPRRRTTIAQQIKGFHKTPDNLTPSQAELYMRVAQMTEDEYKEWLSFDYAKGEYVRQVVKYLQPESEQE